MFKNRSESKAKMNCSFFYYDWLRFYFSAITILSGGVLSYFESGTFGSVQVTSAELACSCSKGSIQCCER
jgi:hypothetical protein